MMSSSSAQHMDTLSGVLALIRNPEMVAKNIELLQEKISAAETATRIAREEQAQAKQLIETQASREAELQKISDELEVKASDLIAKKTALDLYKEGLNAQETSFKSKLEVHSAMSDGLTAREAKLRASEQVVKDRGISLEQAHNARMSKLDHREKGLDERESTLVAAQADIKNKLDTIKRLAV